MITLCYASKGGSGTTFVACSRALNAPRPTLLVDLCGDVPLMLGLGESDRPGVVEWLGSEAPASRLDDLLIDITPSSTLLPAHAFGHNIAESAPFNSDRLLELIHWLVDTAQRTSGHVVIDAGTWPLPAEFASECTHRWLVTRACYLSLKRAMAITSTPTGVVLVDEPGRGLRPRDLESALGAPIVAKLGIDPDIARAVDAGLLRSGRLPRSVRRAIAQAA